VSALTILPGNFLCNDLQQVSTTLVTEADQAVRVATEVSGVYTERNEALVNAGAIALSRESSGFLGFGHVAGNGDWNVLRLSQEHGILSTETSARVDDVFQVGKRVYLYCNHTCITAAAFYVYFVVDEMDIVRETWLPWKGW
jgi:D-serine ammonia-lyase